MKLKEAKEIVGYILDWQFVCMGINDAKNITERLDISKYSLNDLIHANKLVQSNNKRKENLSKYHTAKGHKTNGRSVSMVLADRLIAAVYTAYSFTPNGEIIALINDIGVGCVRVKYNPVNEDDED